jgi:hypothetical protein
MSRASRHLLKLRTRLSVVEVGAREANADNIDYFDEAAEEIGSRGGVIEIPADSFQLSRTWVIANRGVRVIGEGANGTDSITGASRIIGTHNLGPVVRVKNSDISLRDLIVSASSGRTAGAATSGAELCVGVHVECVDVAGGNGQSQRVRMYNVTARDQPNHGIIHIGENAGSVYSDCTTNDNAGHGLVFDRGVLTNRTNKGTPGLVNVIMHKSFDCGGHGFVAGHPDDTDLSSYRMHIVNLEIFRCATDAAVRYTDSAAWIWGDNAYIMTSAFGGDATEYCRGLVIGGRGNRVLGCRYINLSRPAHVAYNVANAPTRDIVFDGMEVRSELGTIYDPAVTHDAGVTNLHVKTHTNVRASGSNNVVRPMVPDCDGYRSEDANGVVWDQKIEARAFNSSPQITIADDAVETLQFSGNQCAGMLTICATTKNAEYGTVWFRVGTSPDTGLLANSTNFAVTTGVLTGTTGVNGNLTISAHTDGKLYIENRTGGSRSYIITLTSTGAAYLTEMF